MQLLSQITIFRPTGNAMIQFLQGDLSAIPADHAADILVISAYPGDYKPLEASLIGALNKKGLSINELAKDKAEDLSSTLHCWLSKPLEQPLQQRLNIKQVLSFEPGSRLTNPEEVVGNIFRCINAFAFEKENSVIAMPVVASGYQRIPVDVILPALLQAAIFWLENGLPLDCIKLVVYRDAQVGPALSIFNTTRDEYKTGDLSDMEYESAGAVGGEPGSADIQNEIDHKSIDLETSPPPAGIPPQIPSRSDENVLPPFSNVVPEPPLSPKPAVVPVPAATPPVQATDQYDYFISYAHTHADLVNDFVQKIKTKNNRLLIFYDRESIKPGGLWIKELSAAIQKAKKVLVFLSPDYDRSPVCWDEFQCAKLMEYNRRAQIIQTIYLYDYKEVQLPPIMGIYSYIDCREGDPLKLNDCVEKILESV